MKLTDIANCRPESHVCAHGSNIAWPSYMRWPKDEAKWFAWVCQPCDDESIVPTKPLESHMLKRPWCLIPEELGFVQSRI